MNSPSMTNERGQTSTTNILARQNNFDLLRFLFAFMVYLFHVYVLSGVENISVFGKLFFSEIAVKCFFVVSGFLIFRSYENSGDAYEYFTKRVRRIYPAYCFVVVACAVFGGVFSVYSWSAYLSFPVLKYIAANLVFLNFLHPTLPGLFEKNTLQAVNGALWTLKIEVVFYFFVPLAIMAFRKFGRISVMVALYIASVVYSIIMAELARRTGQGLFLVLQHQLPGQLVFFIAGAAGYYYLPYLAKFRLWLLVLAVMAIFIQQSLLPWVWVAAQPIALGIFVVYFACVFPCVGNFGKYGDFSYGIYIVHFPILQVLIAHGLFKESPLTMLFVATSLVMAAAIMLWSFIEKLFLRRSSHYVVVSQG